MHCVRVVLCLETECMAVIIVGIALSRQFIIQEIGCIELDARKVRITPVSYTHLDVYKRQTLSFPPTASRTSSPVFL